MSYPLDSLVVVVESKVPSKVKEMGINWEGAILVKEIEEGGNFLASLRLLS